MILYVENSKEHTHTLLRVTKFNKVSGHKINLQKSILFLYISNEQLKH